MHAPAQPMVSVRLVYLEVILDQMTQG